MKIKALTEIRVQT